MNDGMNNPKRIGQPISQAVGQIISLALLLVLALCILLLMPGIVLISWIDDLATNLIPLPMLWLASIAFSVALYGLIRFLVQDSEKSWKLYGAICMSVLLFCIILSVGFQQQFGQRWTSRLMGIPSPQQVLNKTPPIIR